MATKQADKNGTVSSLGDDIDKFLDTRLGRQSEPTQEEIVRHFLVPLARRLMKESPDAYKAILLKECEPFRFYGGEKSGGVPESRQNFRPKN